MEQKAKRFGKFNIIDILAVILILAVVAFVGMKLMDKDETPAQVEKVQITYVVKAECVPVEVYENCRKHSFRQLLLIGLQDDCGAAGVKAVIDAGNTGSNGGDGCQAAAADKGLQGGNLAVVVYANFFQCAKMIQLFQRGKGVVGQVKILQIHAVDAFRQGRKCVAGEVQHIQAGQ